MESSARMRPTVQRLIGLPKASEARRARAATWARSRGGKGGLAPPAGFVFEAEIPLGPAFAPEADGVGVKAGPAAAATLESSGRRCKSKTSSARWRRWALAVR